MEDVLEVYERPYDPDQPVVCVDEKPITLHADVRQASPVAPGREARQDNEYKRCGTANVFCAVERELSAALRSSGTAASFWMVWSWPTSCQRSWSGGAVEELSAG